MPLGHRHVVPNRFSTTHCSDIHTFFYWVPPQCVLEMGHCHVVLQEHRIIFIKDSKSLSHHFVSPLFFFLKKSGLLIVKTDGEIERSDGEIERWGGRSQ